LFGTFLSACDENQTFAPWQLFAAQCCLYSRSNILSFFHIEGLHISANNLSDFCQFDRNASTSDFSFSVICHSESPYLSDA
jgi:hypothetical protein